MFNIIRRQGQISTFHFPIKINTSQEDISRATHLLFRNKCRNLLKCVHLKLLAQINFEGFVIDFKHLRIFAYFHRIIESLGLERTFKSILFQPLCQFAYMCLELPFPLLCFSYDDFFLFGGKHFLESETHLMPLLEGFLTGMRWCFVLFFSSPFSCPTCPLRLFVLPSSSGAFRNGPQLKLG